MMMRAMYAPAGTPADVVPVHAVLPCIGVIGAMAIAAFSVAMVCIATAEYEYGSMRFISEGLDTHCGWSAAIMATAGAAVGLCELIPAVHAGRVGCIWCVLAQLVSWNFVLGVESTGWPVHYAALVVFLASAFWYHTMMSRDATYGHPAYVWSHGALALSIVLFAGAYCGAQAGDGAHAPRDIAVCCELWLVACMCVCVLCLMNSLNRFECIHIRFEPYTSC